MKAIRALGVFAVLLLSSAALAGAEEAAPECPLSEEDRGLVQRALDNWRTLEDEVLRIAPVPLPWIVFFGNDCVWHLAPHVPPEGASETEAPWLFRERAVDTWIAKVEGQVALPDATEVPIAPVAKTVLGPTGPFFVLAMPEIWAAHPAFEGEERRAKLPDFWLGVAAHELVHTRQLAPVVARIESLQEKSDLPESFDDDIVQQIFGSDPEFKERVERELELLFAAAVEEDPTQMREGAREAIQAIQARRAHFFEGEGEVYAELEELFLALEGAATWAAFQLETAGSDESSELRAMEAERSFKDRSWVQAQGLLLYVILDGLVDRWQLQSFTEEVPPGPIQWISEALGSKAAP